MYDIADIFLLEETHFLLSHHIFPIFLLFLQLLSLRFICKLNFCIQILIVGAHQIVVLGPLLFPLVILFMTPTLVSICMLKIQLLYSEHSQIHTHNISNSSRLSKLGVSPNTSNSTSKIKPIISTFPLYES